MMQRQERVLITGAAGYIGSVVSAALLNLGLEVVGVDNLTFGARALPGLMSQPSFKFETLDLTQPSDIANCLARHRPDHVIHLAAIVGDPACKAQPELARRVNVESTKDLFLRCADLKVKRFLFASTCSNYGLSESEKLLSEDSKLNPISLYAEYKVQAEQWLLAQSAAMPQRFVLRFSTAHGLSPRMRFDLTVNEFAKTLLEGGSLDVYDATTWRPYCHVVDFGRVMGECIVSPNVKNSTYVLNVGSDDENFRKIDIVEKIIAAIPQARASVRHVGDGKDRRNYRVSFQRLRDTIGLIPLFTVDRTIDQIAGALKAGAFEEKKAVYANA